MKRALFTLTTILFSLFLNACVSVHRHGGGHHPPPPGHRHHDGAHHHHDRMPHR